MSDLRSYLKQKKYKTLKGLSTDYVIAKALEKSDETLYFKDVEDSNFDVAGNLCCTRAEVCAALGTNREDFLTHVLSAVENPVEPKIVEKGECQEEECSLYDIPVLRHFEKDAGRYITTGIVIAKDPVYGRNHSIHRLLVHDDNKLGIRIVPRHLYEFFKRAEERKEDLEIAIVIGVHPVIFFAAAYSPEIGFDELKIAGVLSGKPVELVKCKSVDIEVPRNAEFVIEGKILAGERRKEGPFCDITGTYDIVREEPVVEVKKVTHRKNAIYHALLPSCSEHKLFMGMPREPEIYRKVREVAKVKNVALTEGGCSWLHGVISIKKEKENVREIIEKAFEAHKSMKHVIIVDEDIDIFNPSEVEFAIATRFQGDKDAYIYKGMKGSTLDPSAGKKGITTKLGIDATKKRNEGKYEKAKIPE